MSTSPQPARSASPTAPVGHRVLPPLVDVLDGLQVVSIPLRTRFRGVRRREIALLQGPMGWGEFSPFLEYPPAEASRWLACAISSAWYGWPEPVRDQVPVNATVPAVTPAEVPEVIARYDGCGTVKVKVAERGQDLRQDLDRVAAVREAVGPSVRLRVDANGGWSVPDAQDALTALATYDLEYAEQPCPTLDDLRTLRTALARAGVEVPIAADESIRKAEDPLQVALTGAADIAVIKAPPLGGVSSALHIAQECGLPIVVSSALDSSVGISAGVALAAALPELPYACGLATVELFDGDVTSDSLVPRGGSIAVRRPLVDAEALDRWSAPAERADWWKDRVHACHDVLRAD